MDTESAGPAAGVVPANAVDQAVAASVIAVTVVGFATFVWTVALTVCTVPAPVVLIEDRRGCRRRPWACREAIEERTDREPIATG